MVAYTLTAATGTYSDTGGVTSLLRVRKLNACCGKFNVITFYTLVAYGQANSPPTYEKTAFYGPLGFKTIGNSTLFASTGTYVVTGNVATLVSARKLPAAKGTYTLTGFNASVAAARQLPAAKGTYTVSGFSAAIAAARKLTAAKGSYVLTGFSATTVAARQLPAAKGTYILTGNAASVAATRQLHVANGAYVLVGNSAALITARQIIAARGTFTYVGNSASLVRLAKLPAGGTSFAVDGKPAAFVDPVRAAAYFVTPFVVRFAAQRQLPAGPRHFVLDGFGARMYNSTFNYADRAVMRVSAVNRTMTVPENRSKNMLVPDEERVQEQLSEDRAMSAPNRNRG